MDRQKKRKAETDLNDRKRQKMDRWRQKMEEKDRNN